MSRFRRYAATLCVAVSLIALSGYVLRASDAQAPTRTWAPGGPFGDLPRDVASAVLPDGRLVVSGGSNSEGQPLALIAIYDPASGSWSPAGQMPEARAGHTVTALEDGRVLITGGRTPGGVTASAEIYDPATGAFTATGALSLARADHAATRLEDGRVLIVGGSDSAAVLATAEMFDPATGSIAQIPAALTTPRMKLSATTLLDGHVLIAGGNNGTEDLASAEIFDANLGTFALTAPLHTPRSGHTALLLPNNNTVLIAGGTSNGTVLNTDERFVHWKERFLADSSAMTEERSGAIAVPAATDGVAVVAGGGSDQAELYSFATLKTDKETYASGETVTLSGSGWQPGETVRLTISKDADNNTGVELTAVADKSGNIVNSEFAQPADETSPSAAPQFFAMATGIASVAQTSGNDEKTLTIHFAGDGSGSVASNGAGGGSFVCSSPDPCSRPGYTSNGRVTLMATPASDSMFVSWSSNVECDNQGCTIKIDTNQDVTATFKKKSPAQAPSTTTVNVSNATYDGAPHGGTAKVIGSGGFEQSLDVTYTGTNGTAYGPSLTAPTNAGDYTAEASFTANTNYSGSSDSKDFSITKAVSAIAVSCPANVSYNGDAQTPCTAEVIGVGGLKQDVSVGYTDNTNVGTAKASASYAGDVNHKESTGSATFEITKAASAVAVTCPTSMEYTGAALEVCSAVVTGAGGLNEAVTPVTYENNTNTGTAKAGATYAGDGNHTANTASATFEITRAASTVKVTCPANVEYNRSAQEVCSAAVTGVGGLNEAVTPVTYENNTNAGTAKASASYAGDANHKPNTGSTMFEITKATPTVTVNWVGGPFTGSAFEAGGWVTGVGSPAEALGKPAYAYYAGETVASGKYLGTAAPVNVGTYTVRASYAGDQNYTTAFTDATITIGAWSAQGFYSPIANGSSFVLAPGAALPLAGAAVWNTSKGGSTVPLKFDVFPNGPSRPESTNVADVISVLATPLTVCTATADDQVDYTDQSGVTSALFYDGEQFHLNWKTPSVSKDTCYRVTATLRDQTTIHTFIKLKK